MSKIVAIDYGAKRIGVAISDSSRKIAFALETISNQKIFNFLDDLLKKEQVSTFVIVILSIFKIRKISFLVK